MLTELSVFNLATFEKVEITFTEGVNIMSGMSGAGKSVLLKALALSMGARFTQKLIRNGCEQAEVIALFDINEEISQKLSSHDIERSETLIVRRVFKKGGRSSNYLNDRLVTNDILTDVTANLATVMSQDEALGLKNMQYQLESLDQYAGLMKLRSEFKESFKKWKTLSIELEGLKKQKSEFADKRQFLEFQYKELEKLKLIESEFEDLEEESKILSHSVELQQATHTLLECSNKFDKGFENAIDLLQSMSSNSESLTALVEEGRSLHLNVEAWSSALRSESHEFENNPSRLQNIDSRLRELRSAFKKFGKEESELMEYFKNLKEQLNEEDFDISFDKLEKDCKKSFSECRDIAKKLHEQRLKKSKALSKQINKTLNTLEMDGERFSITLEYDVDKMHSAGASSLVFMLQATSSSPATVFHETASGGERSRALLAICSAMSKIMKNKLLVFDEIDTNIGSRLGKPVADAFSSLSKDNQLICVTHLAPVAASGNKHFLIEKDDNASMVTELKGKARLSEIAQMIAGEKDSAEAIKQAKHMLKKKE
jgi:DNA repair protein RecN (Recombination protein N)